MAWHQVRNHALDVALQTLAYLSTLAQHTQSIAIECAGSIIATHLLLASDFSAHKTLNKKLHVKIFLAEVIQQLPRSLLVAFHDAYVYWQLK